MYVKANRNKNQIEMYIIMHRRDKLIMKQKEKINECLLYLFVDKHIVYNDFVMSKVK